MQIPDVRVLGVRFREEARDGKGMGGHTPVGYSSPAKRPAMNWRAAPLALSSPLAKAETERERGRRAGMGEEIVGRNRVCLFPLRTNFFLNNIILIVNRRIKY